MAKEKKKLGQDKKKAGKAGKAKTSKPTFDSQTDATAISNGAMKDAFRQAFLRREI